MILDNQNINISELNFTKPKKEFANIKTNFNINNKEFLINDFNLKIKMVILKLIILSLIKIIKFKT